MEQFSHDLTVALEETSKSGGVRTACWGVRRRTRSTGNLPCAPQPTEDSSSSPADGTNNGHHHHGAGGGPAHATTGADGIHSDSDDHRQSLRLSLTQSRQSCQFGNFESDSLNETTFSPARPNARRKRKFKRMAVEYETTPSTPGTTGTLATMATMLTSMTDDGAQGAIAADADDADDADGDCLGAIGHFGKATTIGPATVANVGTNSLGAQNPGAASVTVAGTSFAGGCTVGHIAAGAALKKRPLKHHYHHHHQHHHYPHGGGGAQSENFRANLFFYGKRKRSHRDRYSEQHSSSVPRQQRGDHMYTAKNSYTEYRSRNRSFSSAGPRAPCERIAPLHTSIVSKIEKIAQDTRRCRQSAEPVPIDGVATASAAAYHFNEAMMATTVAVSESPSARTTTALIFQPRPSCAGVFGATAAAGDGGGETLQHRIGFNAVSTGDKVTQTFGGLASLHMAGLQAAAAAAQASANSTAVGATVTSNTAAATTTTNAINMLPRFGSSSADHHHHPHYHHHTHAHQRQHHQPSHPAAAMMPSTVTHSGAQHRKQHRRSVTAAKRAAQQLKMRLQFDDPHAMDDGGGGGGLMAMSDMVSSSSMSSSSDSEAAQRNDTDREGDDELTDWPGNEAMVNFASKNDFKRAAKQQPLQQRGTAASLVKATTLSAFATVCDEDTLMSADDLLESGATAAAQPPTTLQLVSKYGPSTSSAARTTQPIAIGGGSSSSSMQLAAAAETSEMSGETSNHFLSSPGAGTGDGGCGGDVAGAAGGSFGTGGAFEVREIRAGCRRIRNERPGFTILTSVNEDLSKFLQDARKEQLRLPDTDAVEHEKLVHLANLYSLSMHGEDGYLILTKTSNTMQSVKIDRSSSNVSKRFLSDYKRRCYGGDEDPESSGMAS